MWPPTTLGGLCDAGQYGLNAAALKGGGGVRFIRITDIDASGHLGDADPAYVDASIPELHRYELQRGDLLIARSGATAGKSMLFRGLSERAVFAGYLIRFKARADRVLPEYVAYYLQSPAYWRYIRKTARAAAQPNVNARELASLPVPLAPAREQRRIVDLLSRAENIVRMRRQAEAKAKEIIPALFLDMFGGGNGVRGASTEAHRGPQNAANTPSGFLREAGEAIRLGEVAKRITKGESPKWQGFDYLSTGVRFITSENVRWGTLDIQEGKYIAPEFDHKLRRSSLGDGDVLVNLVGASVGRAACVHAEALPANVNQAVAVISLDTRRCLPQFLLAQLLSGDTQASLLGQAVEGARANISLSNIRELPIWLPPICVQERFVARVNDINDIHSMHARAGALAARAFESLLAGVYGDGL